LRRLNPSSLYKQCKDSFKVYRVRWLADDFLVVRKYDVREFYNFVFSHAVKTVSPAKRSQQIRYELQYQSRVVQEVGTAISECCSSGLIGGFTAPLFACDIGCGNRNAHRGDARTQMGGHRYSRWCSTREEEQDSVWNSDHTDHSAVSEGTTENGVALLALNCLRGHFLSLMRGTDLPLSDKLATSVAGRSKIIKKELQLADRLAANEEKIISGYLKPKVESQCMLILDRYLTRSLPPKTMIKNRRAVLCACVSSAHILSSEGTGGDIYNAVESRIVRARNSMRRDSARWTWDE
jgi:hypothetical protein